MRDGALSQALLYRVLHFGDLRQRVEDGRKAVEAKREKPGGTETAAEATTKRDLSAAPWRAQWGYQLARNVLQNKRLTDAQKAAVGAKLNELLGLDRGLKDMGKRASPRTAISIALYRNRSYSKGGN